MTFLLSATLGVALLAAVFTVGGIVLLANSSDADADLD